MRLQKLRFFSFLLLLLAFSGQVFAQNAKSEVECMLKRRSGNIIYVLQGEIIGNLPEIGTICEMSKQFDQTLGKMTMKGWLGVATVKVLARNEDSIKLEILEEKSEITVNDEKVDHFKVGNIMKLTWETEKKAEE